MRLLFIPLIFISSFFLSTEKAPAAQNTLPRTVGAFALGMTTQQFEKVTGIKPEDCPRCDDNEEYADIDDFNASKLLKLQDGRTSMDVFFFKHKLSHFAFSLPFENNIVTIQRMNKLYGQPFHLYNGLEWQDTQTKIRIDFINNLIKTFIVEYSDVKLNDLHDKQEKRHRTNPEAH